MEISISDHAIVRYMERVYGLNIDDLKAEMITPQIMVSIGALGDGRYPVGNGNAAQCHAIVVNNTVVSVIHRSQPVSNVTASQQTSKKIKYLGANKKSKGRKGFQI